VLLAVETTGRRSGKSWERIYIILFARLKDHFNPRSGSFTGEPYGRYLKLWSR
jgi:hypothetical protein